MLTREQKAWLITGFCNTDKGCSDGCALYDICKNNHDDFILCEEAELDACLKIIAPELVDTPKPAISEIKPCPFCGGEAKLKTDTRYPRPACEPRKAFEIVCQNPKCIIGGVDENYYPSEKQAIEAWNRRI